MIDLLLIASNDWHTQTGFSVGLHCYYTRTPIISVGEWRTAAPNVHSLPQVLNYYVKLCDVGNLYVLQALSYCFCCTSMSYILVYIVSLPFST